MTFWYFIIPCSRSGLSISSRSSVTSVTGEPVCSDGPVFPEDWSWIHGKRKKSGWVSETKEMFGVFICKEAVDQMG